MAARAKRRRGGMTKPNPKVNEALAPGPRDPASWGPADELPGGKSRAISKSTVQRMFEQGSLDADQLRAAVEIEAVFMMVSGALFAKGQKYERVGGGLPMTAPEWAIRIYKDRYLPWCNELNTRNYGPETDLAYAIRVIIDGHSLQQMDAEQRWAKGTASQMVKSVLSLYVKRAVATSGGGKSRRVA